MLMNKKGRGICTFFSKSENCDQFLRGLSRRSAETNNMEGITLSHITLDERMNTYVDISVKQDCAVSEHLFSPIVDITVLSQPSM